MLKLACQEASVGCKVLFLVVVRLLSQDARYENTNLCYLIDLDVCLSLCNVYSLGLVLGIVVVRTRHNRLSLSIANHWVSSVTKCMLVLQHDPGNYPVHFLFLCWRCWFCVCLVF